MARRAKSQHQFMGSVRKVTERMLLFVLVLVCIGAFYLAVILAEVPADQNAPEATSVPSVTLTAEQPRQIGSLAELTQLTEHFPAPVLALQANSQIQFSGGLVNDLAYKGVFARQVTLTYQTQNGETLKLYSIYPADAFSLLPEGGYELGENMTAALAGMTAVRMENSDTVRLHVRGESALYALNIPKLEDEALAEITRQAMLVTP